MNADVRAVIYGLAGAILALLVGYELVSPERAVEWSDFVDKLVPAVILFMAYRHTPSKTLPGTATPGDSDSDPEV